MPIYEYRCRKCGEQFEALRPVGDNGKRLACPKCGAKGPEKQLSTFAVTGTCDRCSSAPT
jgi:putative FmdB family regulatory protein